MNVDEYHEFTVYGGVNLTLATFRYRPGVGPGQGEFIPIEITCTPHDVIEQLIEY